MGLDMYLFKMVYVGAEYEHRQVRGTIEISHGEKPVPVNFNRVSYILEQVGCWRKANAIHAWLVENAQEGNDDCGYHYVEREKLQELLVLVNQVIADHSLAPELLPTQDGFFFGSTEYDNWYFEDLKLTKQILETVLAEEDADEFMYHSSW